MTTNTPETDAVAIKHEADTEPQWYEMVDADFARSLETRLAVAEQRLKVAQAGLKAVEGLINESRGVDGLHLNGDVAPWSELRTEGRFGEWLADFDTALDALAKAGGEKP